MNIREWFKCRSCNFIKLSANEEPLPEASDRAIPVWNSTGHHCGLGFYRSEHGYHPLSNPTWPGILEGSQNCSQILSSMLERWDKESPMLWQPWRHIPIFAMPCRGSISIQGINGSWAPPFSLSPHKPTVEREWHICPHMFWRHQIHTLCNEMSSIPGLVWENLVSNEVDGLKVLFLCGITAIFEGLLVCETGLKIGPVSPFLKGL